MSLLEPKYPDNQSFAFLWLLGGIVAGGGAIGGLTSQLEALEWALLALALVMIGMFGERLGYVLGYGRARWEANHSSKDS